MKHIQMKDTEMIKKITDLWDDLKQHNVYVIEILKRRQKRV